MSYVTNENYYEMVNRISKLQNDDMVVGSSNFDKLLNYLSSDDSNWIHEINASIEEFAYVTCNHVRPHSYNGYKTPFETRYATAK